MVGAATGRSAVRGVALVVVLLFLTVSAAAAGSAARSPVRFQTLKVVDPLSNGIEAFRLLVPKSWIWKGGVQWNLNYATLASVTMRVRNPRGLEAVESYPLIPQVWSTATLLGPEGSNYLGSEVRAPLGAPEFLVRLVIPTLRGGLSPTVRSVVPLPRVVAALASMPQDPSLTSSYAAARVRIGYRQDGRLVDEDFYVGLSYQRSAILPSQTLWQPLFLYSFKAARGSLDRASRTLQAIVASVRPSLKWFAGYQSVQQLWLQGQMQSIRAAGALSRAISEANDSISSSISQSWRTQQDAYDRVYDRVSEQVRGVETYDNPFEDRPVQLPSDYRYAWVSARGDYVLSDQAGFDPNVGATVDWRLLRPS